ncbi:DNA-binding transcriptional MerR regulator [Fontibacillus solani]|uniref:DNA-binding transcriptional MerR regulator n=1 Tax=Fontibacillus solani TaxID=1572857 RepID=A0A7W3XSB4_9BACL|nr:MerR family transcriptional regulator [Fontibacillus solani]MBA9086361.1 DNA-binding transcriptional MerR regulator [Fontibacillus solani]
MSDNRSQYFTTSELAKMCGVTKHTLFHYDEIGLLKPEFVNDKGYRFYSIQQCYALDIINMMKKTGSSLKDIKEFIQNQNTPVFLEILKKKLHDLDVERNRIKRMQGFLRDAIEMTEQAKEELPNEPFIEECEEEYFIATQLKQGDGDKEYAHKLSEHRDYCENRLNDHEFPIWTIVGKERFELNDFYPDYIANKVKNPLMDERLIIKPKGLYVVMHHRGSYETMIETYRLLKKYIGGNKMIVSGNAYALDLLSYFTEKNPKDYVLRISVKVELLR